MNKRIFSLFCILAVVLVFALTAQTASISWNAGAEDTTSSTTKKSAQEEPYVEPDTSATSATQPPMPTSGSTTKKEESSTDPTQPTQPTQPTSHTDPTQPTNHTDPTQPTNKPPVSESEPTSGNVPSSEKETTKKTPVPSTTKKGGKTTTKHYVPSTTKRATPHMTIPQVENTTVDGTTLSPLDAYFERISGDSNTFATVSPEETQATEPEEEEKGHSQLSTIALVAICLGGIALVTVALTAIFAIRNKHSDAEEDVAPDYEQDAYGTGNYEQPDSPMQSARPQVDESDSFTVVSLDDKDYKD